MSVEEESVQMAVSYLRAVLRASRSLTQAGREGLNAMQALYKFQRDVRIGRTGKKSFSGKYGLARNCRSLSFLVIPDQKGPDGELSEKATRDLIHDLEKELKQCGISFAYTNKSFAPDGIGTTIAIDGDAMETAAAIIQQKKYKDAGIDFPTHLTKDNFNPRDASREDQDNAQATYDGHSKKSKGGQPDMARSGKENAVSKNGHDLFDAQQYEPTEKQKYRLSKLMKQDRWGPNQDQRFEQTDINNWLSHISEADASAMIAELDGGEAFWGTPPPDGFRRDNPPTGPSLAQRGKSFKPQTDRKEDPILGGGKERLDNQIQVAGQHMAEGLKDFNPKARSAPTHGSR